MEYEEFKETLRTMVEDGLGEDARVSLSSVTKNNGQSRDAIIISREGGNISPTIYLEGFWRMYQKGERVEEMARQMIVIYKESDLGEELDMNMFFDFNNVKDHIVYKVINKEKNKKLLSEVPYVDYLDLAIVFCYIFKGGELDNATILIHNSHMDYWNVDVSELMEHADNNTRRLLGCNMKNIFEYLKKIYSMDELLAEGCGEDELLPMYVLSNDSGLFGAGCILYKGLLKSISEEMGSDFYVFPSSVHEVILMPDNDRSGAQYYREMVKEINCTELSKEDVLSDSVYYYSRKEDKLKQLA